MERATSPSIELLVLLALADAGCPFSSDGGSVLPAQSTPPAAIPGAAPRDPAPPPGLAHRND
jgi:hypothetical protein